MKKQEIKRRKRVVPVGSDVSQAPSSVSGYSPPRQHLATPTFEHSGTLDPSSALPSTERDHTPAGPRGPLAIDFTNYYSSASTAPRSQGQLASPVLPVGARSPRKRSLSSTFDAKDSAPTAVTAHIPHRPHDISSLLNPTAPSDSQIDPALSNMNRRPRASPVSQEDKSARKEKLRREAEAMREELARKERELQELDD